MQVRLLRAGSLFLLVSALSSYTSAADIQALYNGSCVTCHSAGVLGAPKTGDKAEWANRMKQGMPKMIASVKNGYKNMPARGLCDNCTDADYQALIEYMAK